MSRASDILTGQSNESTQCSEPTVSNKLAHKDVNSDLTFWGLAWRRALKARHKSEQKYLYHTQKNFILQQNQGISVKLSLCRSVAHIEPNPFSGLALDLPGALLMTQGCAFWAFVVVWTLAAINSNKNLAHFAFHSSSSTLLWQNINSTTLLLQPTM